MWQTWAFNTPFRFVIEAILLIVWKCFITTNLEQFPVDFYFEPQRMSIFWTCAFKLEWKTRMSCTEWRFHAFVKRIFSNSSQLSLKRCFIHLQWNKNTSCIDLSIYIALIHLHAFVHYTILHTQHKTISFRIDIRYSFCTLIHMHAVHEYSSINVNTVWFPKVWQSINMLLISAYYAVCLSIRDCSLRLSLLLKRFFVCSMKWMRKRIVKI